jgi:hypothetical protein
VVASPAEREKSLTTKYTKYTKGRKMDNKTQLANEKLLDALQALRDAKPNDRSELDRRLAIAITELEKVVAFYNYYVVQS